MKYFKINVIIIPLIFILSCGDNPDAKIIVDEYLFEQLIDSLDNKHELKSKEILIGRYESNEVIEFIKQDLENEFGRDSVGPGSLVKELIPTLGDSINFNSHTDFKDYNIIWGSTGRKSLGNIYSESKCILYMSKTIYSSNKKAGCFYVSIGEINSPAGYIVFIAKPDKKWEIFSIIKKWG